MLREATVGLENHCGTFEIKQNVATPISRTIAQPILGLTEADHPDAFDADGTTVLPSKMDAPYTSSSVNLHAFSCFGAEPAVSQRTVNETAAIVAI